MINDLLNLRVEGVEKSKLGTSLYPYAITQDFLLLRKPKGSLLTKKTHLLPIIVLPKRGGTITQVLLQIRASNSLFIDSYHSTLAKSYLIEVVSISNTSIVILMYALGCKIPIFDHVCIEWLIGYIFFGSYDHWMCFYR